MKYRRAGHRKRRSLNVSRLMARDGTACAICGGYLDRSVRDHDHPQYVTFDHIVPRSRGGDSKLENLRLAHRLCNTKRGNDPILPDEENPS